MKITIRKIHDGFVLELDVPENQAEFGFASMEVYCTTPQEVESQIAKWLNK